MKKPATASNVKKTNIPVSSSTRDKITEQDYEELKATFDLFDDDGSGSIDPIEIQKIMEELGLTRRNPTVGEIFTDLKNANRSINFDEFLEIVVNRVGDTKTRDGLNKVFNHWDKEGSGNLDLACFKQVARELGETLNEEELIEMMHNTYILNNTNSNEYFNFDEFYTIATKKRN